MNQPQNQVAQSPLTNGTRRLSPPRTNSLVPVWTSFQEQIFATQLLMNNSYLLDVAKKNLSSLRLAMYNVAAVGLTLNPNQGWPIWYRDD